MDDQRMREHRENYRGGTAAKENVTVDLITQALGLAGTVHLRVTGASMLPTIWPGDVLTVRRIEFDELQAGEIAVFRRAGQLITHRVICKGKESATAQGDAKLNADVPYQREDVVGSVVAVHRGRKEVGTAPRKSAAGRMLGAALVSSQLLTRIAVQLNRAVNTSWR